MLKAYILAALLMKGSSQTPCACLPEGIDCRDVVSATAKPSISMENGNGGEGNVKRVDQALAEIKARCVRGRLVDGKRRPIRFFRMTGCWGNPPADYQEILQRQQSELEELRKSFRVIELTCNPSGAHLR